MRAIQILIMWSVLVGSPITVPAQAEPTAVGLWEQVNDQTGRVDSWIKITERNGTYEGTIIKLFLLPGDEPNPLCDRCEGPEKNAPILSLKLIKGMQRNGSSYEGATIMDPRDGTVYRALTRLSPDGQQLEVRGYVGISLLGRSQVWRRLPEQCAQTSGGGLSPSSRTQPGQKN
jgi:uncharacterized protein (DUF2147 family)